MLAALSHHITKLEQKLDEQAQELSLLKLREPSCNCSGDVASLRAQVGDNRCRLDCLSARVDKAVVAANGSGAAIGACKTVASSKEIKLEILKPPASFQFDDRNQRSAAVGGSCGQIGSFGKPFCGNSSSRLPVNSGSSDNTHLTPSEFFSTFSNFQLLDINTHKPPHVTSTPIGGSASGAGSGSGGHKSCSGSFTNISVIAKPTQSELGALNRSTSSRCCDVGSAAPGANSVMDRSSRHDLLTSPQSSFTSVPSANSSSFTAWSTANDVIKQAPTPTTASLALPSPTSSQLQRKSLSSSSDISLDNIRAIAAENSGLRNQLVAYRKKVESVEQALAVKDVTIVELRNQCDHGAHKEREWEQRQDWLEHKLKLLKQDKRRRGETIGKLLKVIDDLKDGGRLDESKVKDGRAVLSMTLQTRHLQHDERVCRVVDAVEYDRVPRTSSSNTPSRQGTPDGCCASGGGGGGNDNCNNSQRYVVGAASEFDASGFSTSGSSASGFSSRNLLLSYDNSDKETDDNDVDDVDDDVIFSPMSSSWIDDVDVCYSCSCSSCSMCADEHDVSGRDDVSRDQRSPGDASSAVVSYDRNCVWQH